MYANRQLRLVDDPRTKDEAHALRVAFVSGDRRCVDQHFGTATGFMIYRVSPADAVRVGAVQFGEAVMDADEGKLVQRIAAIADCDVVFTAAIGASAIRRLLARGVQPFRVPAGSTIARLIGLLQRELAEGDRAWLRRMKSAVNDNPARFDTMEAEGWQETE